MRSAFSSCGAGRSLEAFEALLDGLVEEDLQRLKADWPLWARPDQLPPSAAANGEPWRTWLILGGRGAGKTRTGAEWVRAQALGLPVAAQRPTWPAAAASLSPAAAGSFLPATAASLSPAAAGSFLPATAGRPAGRIALVGETYAQVRAVMVEGVSGILSVHGPGERPHFEPTKRQVTWPNGTIAQLFSADEPEALRGPQFACAWVDEIAKWRNPDTCWDMLQFGLRLGTSPRVVATTTPRPLALLERLIADATTALTRAPTRLNAVNLAPTFLADIERRYGDTALGRQELEGEIIAQAAGRLWKRDWIEAARVARAPELTLIVVGVDPPVSATERSDACGIVVAGLGGEGRIYVLADRTLQGAAAGVWARAAAEAAEAFGAGRIVAEVNQGGDLILQKIRQYAGPVKVSPARAHKNKWLRAEPVAGLYAEGRVSHVGWLNALEAEMLAFGGGGALAGGRGCGATGGRSPDRVDALVWAVLAVLDAEAVQPGIRVL